MILIFQNPLSMLKATHHLLIPMNPSLTIPLHQMTKTLHQMTFFKTHEILILRQILPHLSNKLSKLLIIITILTEPVTHLKTNQNLLMLQIVEIPKLITTQDNNPNRIIVFSNHHLNFESIIQTLKLASISQTK